MASVAAPKVLQSLEIIAKYVTGNPAETPVEFVRELAHHWKERGGLVAGKPRHSDRYLDDVLRWQGTPVKSLTPKLVGRTHLKPADAGVLIRLFLSHWDYVGDPDSGEVTARSVDVYKPLLSAAEIEGVCGYVAERISSTGPEARSEVVSETDLSASAQDTADLIAMEFQKSTALFTVGAGQTVLVPRQDMALIGFRNLMNRLRAIEEADGRERILIWTLDLGRQDFDDPESRARFMNVESLISRFKALRRFTESATEARWNWLRSRTIVVLHDTRSGRPDVFRLPTFDPHHVLFSAIPPRWAGLPEFLALYGRERLHETAYTIFLGKTEGFAGSNFLGKTEGFAGSKTSANAISPGASRTYELRYFGHALLKSDEKGELAARGLRLTPPGRSYVEALGTVFVAAAQMLGLPSMSADLWIDGMKIEPAHATEKLRHHCLLLLRLDEFVKF